ncbi:TraB/GumN family protein [Aestuariicoccus sp. MJ-SS9]|uniref:TraB/GumN family protein n=1 Tax=Aestuariicoccus sp. MJ-SS9 TaxID=3079855 RepID=UPI002906011B|nr:TraB/GumN family protein [Aestuariicoccus sp. MJ-SS9]MDU8909656.1 TraB/GumN family protein [Aestuariicoccus sp. MJ-SS9]
MTRFLTACLIWVLASAASAQCTGTDLRPTLTGAERTELTAATAAAPYTSGNHWRAERDGEVLHVIGTMHLGDPRLDGPTARLAPVVENAALLLLEITKAEEKELQKAIATDPGMITLRDTSLPELMDAAAWQTLAEAAAERGLPAFMAAKFQPWYLSMLLALPPCMSAMAQEADGLDARLQKLARENGVPTRSLEPYDTIFRLFTATPLEEQIDMLGTAILPPGAAEDQFATLLAAYFEEAHYESWIASRILARRDAPAPPAEMDASFDRMEQVMLTARNQAWIPVITDALDTTEGTVVAAFGAGHLGGPGGILNLLDEAGFTLTRQPF